ncbi:hypothetical protein BST61_g3320 [Cercospora zeina]
MAPRGNDVFPVLQACNKIGTSQTLFDVRFWPYGTGDDEHVFALTGGTATCVYRTRRGADPPFELLRHMNDEVEPHATPASLNSLAWTEDPVTRTPWLCVAGDGQHHIKILDFDVTHYAQPPRIRFQRLHYSPMGLAAGLPGAAMCEGEADSDWGTASIPLTIQLPHFFTKELHPNYVDSLDFYGDLILSKAARDQTDAKKHRYANEILLWKIHGFDADEPPSERLPVQEAGKYTGSAFPHDEEYRAFSRLLTLDIPHTDRFYHRFGFFHDEGKRPVLCMGDQMTRFSFWDLQRFEEGIDPLDRPSMQPRNKAGRKKKKKGPDVLGELRRNESGASSASGQTPETSSTGASSTTAPESREYTLSDRFTPLAPHYRVTANTELPSVGGKISHFATSQIAWSPDGTWMVTVGDHGMICLFHRDESVT